jgi:hypothetical protein
MSTFNCIYPSMATTMNDLFVINVGGRAFTTLKSTLERSPYFAIVLSSRWTETPTYHVNGAPFVDRGSLLFEHNLNLLRSAAPPGFWTRTNGFDLPLYSSLLCETEHFQVKALATWIRKEHYIDAIRTTSYIEVSSLSDCGHGLSHAGDIEKEFEPGTVSRSSNSGKYIIFSKRLVLQRTRLRLPVSDRAFFLMRVMTDIKADRIHCGSKAVPIARTLMSH